jgi:hypothetical protein
VVPLELDAELLADEVLDAPVDPVALVAPDELDVSGPAREPVDPPAQPAANTSTPTHPV